MLCTDSFLLTRVFFLVGGRVLVCWLVGWFVHFRTPQLAHEPLSSLPSGLIPKDYRSLKTQYLQVRPGDRVLEGTWWREVIGHFRKRQKKKRSLSCPHHPPVPMSLPLRGCGDGHLSHAETLPTVLVSLCSPLMWPMRGEFEQFSCWTQWRVLTPGFSIYLAPCEASIHLSFQVLLKSYLLCEAFPTSLHR